MCLSVSVQLDMHFVAPTQVLTHAQRSGVWHDPHPGPVAICFSRFRSQSYETAHSPAAQHASLFILVCCGAMLSVLWWVFFCLFVYFWLSAYDREREVLPLQTYCQAMLGLLWQQDARNQWMKIDLSICRKGNCIECDFIEINTLQR